MPPFHLDLLNQGCNSDKRVAAEAKMEWMRNSKKYTPKLPWCYCKGSVLLLQYLKSMALLSPGDHIFPSIHPFLAAPTSPDVSAAHQFRLQIPFFLWQDIGYKEALWSWFTNNAICSDTVVLWSSRSRIAEGQQDIALDLLCNTCFIRRPTFSSFIYPTIRNVMARVSRYTYNFNGPRFPGRINGPVDTA